MKNLQVLLIKKELSENSSQYFYDLDQFVESIPWKGDADKFGTSFVKDYWPAVQKRGSIAVNQFFYIICIKNALTTDHPSFGLALEIPQPVQDPWSWVFGSDPFLEESTNPQGIDGLIDSGDGLIAVRSSSQGRRYSTWRGLSWSFSGQRWPKRVLKFRAFAGRI